jgi:hypothetical protein
MSKKRASVITHERVRVEFISNLAYGRFMQTAGKNNQLRLKEGALNNTPVRHFNTLTTVRAKQLKLLTKLWKLSADKST